jgi:hypothetical protein
MVDIGRTLRNVLHKRGSIRHYKVITSNFILFVPYIYVICTIHLCYLYRTFMLFVPCIYVICTLHFLDYLKSRSNKCTLFIICYLIQFILKVVQHVSHYVSLSSGTQLFITPAIDVWYSLNSTQLATFYLLTYIVMSTICL